MTGVLLFVLALAVLSYGLSGGSSSQRATPEEIAAARLVVGARLRRLAEEREERFRRYDRAWNMARRPVPGRGYVLDFHARARRG